MTAITESYVEQLPEIYKDVLKAFPLFNPPQRLGDGVAMQSLYSGLRDKYTLAQVRVACEKMADAGVVTIENEIFVHPLPLGSRLIEQLTAQDVEKLEVPDFPPLEGEQRET